MTRVFSNAEGLFQAACSGAAGGATDYAILETSGGSLHLVAGADWSLDVLAREHNAAAAYRVTRRTGSVAVEARSGLDRCRLQYGNPGQLARALLGY